MSYVVRRHASVTTRASGLRTNPVLTRKFRSARKLYSCFLWQHSRSHAASHLTKPEQAIGVNQNRLGAGGQGMWRTMRMAALAAAVTLVLGGFALAHDGDDYYYGRDNGSARQYGYQNGYRDGVNRGLEEGR